MKTKRKKSFFSRAALLLCAVLLCLCCLPLQAQAQSTTIPCDPEHRAALGPGIHRTDDTRYTVDTRFVEKLCIQEPSGPFQVIELDFLCTADRSHPMYVGFTLIVADAKGKIQGEFFNRVKCSVGIDFALFDSSRWESGDEESLDRFIEDYRSGGGNYQIYIDSVTLEPVNGCEWGITRQPADQTVAAGRSAAFTIETSGNGLSYQWFVDRSDGKGWTEIAGATEATFVTAPADKSWNGFRYFCRVTGPEGAELDSEQAVLHVGKSPVTGDPAEPVLWLTLLPVSAFAILLMNQKRRGRES